MLGRRRRRRANIKTALDQWLALLGCYYADPLIPVAARSVLLCKALYLVKQQTRRAVIKAITIQFLYMYILFCTGNNNHAVDAVSIWCKMYLLIILSFINT